MEDEQELDRLEEGRHLAIVEERSERFDELTRVAEALGRCKPQEVIALMLKAHGLSYAEIAGTYTKRVVSSGPAAAGPAPVESECDGY